jgi:hypothetical protein
MFAIKIDTDNDAFSPASGFEVARILEEIAGKLKNGETSGKCVDVNGNSVGGWTLED